MYEATPIWKIDNFLAKYMEAKTSGCGKDNIAMPITSPYFGTSLHGYRLRLTAYLYGYETG